MTHHPQGHLQYTRGGGKTWFFMFSLRLLLCTPKATLRQMSFRPMYMRAQARIFRTMKCRQKYGSTILSSRRMTYNMEHEQAISVFVHCPLYGKGYISSTKAQHPLHLYALRNRRYGGSAQRLPRSRKRSFRHRWRRRARRACPVLVDDNTPGVVNNHLLQPDGCQEGLLEAR